MRGRALSPCLVFLLAAAACAPDEGATADEAAAPAAETAATDPAADADRIRQLSAEWSAQATDPDAFVNYFAPGGVLMPDNSPPLSSPDAIRTWVGETAAMPNMSVSWSSDRVEIAASGDLAYETGTYRLGFDAPDGRVEDEGKYVTIWEKVGGEWKVAADIFNSNLPAPAQQ